MTVADPDRVCPEALKEAAEAARQPCDCPHDITSLWCPRHGDATGRYRSDNPPPSLIDWDSPDGRTLMRLADLTMWHGPWEAARIVFARTAERTSWPTPDNRIGPDRPRRHR